MLVSRLDYDDMNIFTGEAFARLDFNNGWFIKGYVGGGGLFGGKLKDEDFRAGHRRPIRRRSATTRAARCIYGSVDAGIKLVRGPDFHVGAFVGYHFMRDYVDAMGCTQIAAQSRHLRRPAIPDSVRGHLADQQLALAARSAWKRRWSSTGAGSSRVDAAWLPYAALYGADSHLLRIGTDPGDFTGPIPEDGKGWGYQFDAIVSYRFNDWISVGAGGRYWHVRGQGPHPFRGPRGRRQRPAAGRALAGRPFRRLPPGQHQVRSLPG